MKKLQKTSKILNFNEISSVWIFNRSKISELFVWTACMYAGINIRIYGMYVCIYVRVLL